MAVVGIIGAGAAGLCAAKHAANAGFQPIVWEKARVMGGTWVYTDQVEEDEFGLPIHSCIFKNVRCVVIVPSLILSGLRRNYAKNEFVHTYCNIN